MELNSIRSDKSSTSRCHLDLYHEKLLLREKHSREASCRVMAALAVEIRPSPLLALPDHLDLSKVALVHYRHETLCHWYLHHLLLGCRRLRLFALTRLWN
jgi:hypothetical protein